MVNLGVVILVPLRQDLKKLLQEYENLFPDVPSRTGEISHDLDVRDAPPVKQHPYRVNTSKQQHLTIEIKYLSENDLVGPSCSSWSFPCLLVPKPDRSYRVCTDYRKVNNVTTTDTSPNTRMDNKVKKRGVSLHILTPTLNLVSAGGKKTPTAMEKEQKHKY